MKNKKITILGAGITGLATAHWLNKDGYDVTILESKGSPGGSMITEKVNDFLIDFGPNSGLETTPKIREIVNDVGLSNEMIYANEEGNTRYILKNNSLIALPTSPDKFLKTNLFSIKAKLRLMKEPFVGKSNDGYYQSIAEFVERRLGKEFLDYAIDPFVSGVFAGDPTKLSVQSAFPKLYRLEEKYGGLIKGMIRGAKERKQRNEESKQSAKMFSFINGMQSFPRAIAKSLGDKVIYNAAITKIQKEDKWLVNYSVNGEEKVLKSDIVFSSIPSYKLSEIFSGVGDSLLKHLEDIYYPPVLVLYLGYEKDIIGKKLDGFGFLIPSKERKKYLGAIWTSTIFKNRATEDKASFTIFVGGARNPNLSEDILDETIDEVIKEFQSIMNIKGSPILIQKKFWKKAIPQYNLGHIEHEKYFDNFETENPGIFLGGNYRGGISVGDCIKNSYLNYEKIKNYING